MSKIAKLLHVLSFSQIIILSFILESKEKRKKRDVEEKKWENEYPCTRFNFYTINLISCKYEHLFIVIVFFISYLLIVIVLYME